MNLKRYLVAVPISVISIVEVIATNQDIAIERAVEIASLEDVEEWSTDNKNAWVLTAEDDVND